MLCENCGNELDKFAKFCPVCGRKTNIVQEHDIQHASNVTLQKSSTLDGPGKLLYETKGISKKRATLIILTSLILVLGGIFFINLAQSRYSGVTVSDARGYYRGVIGGGYRFNEKGRQFFQILGIICIVEGILNLFSYISIKKSEFHIYENCICGVEYYSVLGLQFKKEFELDYYQIKEVQKVSNFLFEGLRINTATDKYAVTLKNSALEPYQLIRTKIK